MASPCAARPAQHRGLCAPFLQWARVKSTCSSRPSPQGRQLWDGTSGQTCRGQGLGWSKRGRISSGGRAILWLLSGAGVPVAASPGVRGQRAGHLLGCPWRAPPSPPEIPEASPPLTSQAERHREIFHDWQNICVPHLDPQPPEAARPGPCPRFCLAAFAVVAFPRELDEKGGGEPEGEERRREKVQVD